MNTDNFLKNTLYTLLVLILLTPFIVSPSLLFPYIAGKAFIFRILVEVMFFVWIILALRNKDYRPKRSLIMISSVIFVVMIGISNIFGVNPSFSFWSNYERMEGYINILHLFVMFVVVGSLLKTREEWTKVIRISVIISLIMLWKSLAQFFGYTEISQGGDRLDATFGNPIYLASYNVIHIFFGLYLFLTKDFLRKNWHKVFVAITIILHLFVLYYTNTRGAILGLVAGLLIVALLNVLTIKKTDLLVWKISLAGLVILVASIAGFFFVKDSDFVQNNAVLSRFADISLTSGTSEARLLNWGVALDGFKEHSILGWGMGNYSVVFDKYYDPGLYGNELWFDHVHNVFLDWLIAGGIVGLALYLFVIFSLIWTIGKNKEFTNVEKNIFLGLVVGYLIQNLFVFDNQTSYIYFFLILAMFHSMNGTAISVFSANIKKEIQYVVGVLTAIVVVIIIYSANIPGYFASKNIIGAYKDMSYFGQASKTNPEQAKGYVQSAIAHSYKAAKYNSFAKDEVNSKGLGDLMLSVLQMPDMYVSPEEKQKFAKFTFDQLYKQAQENPNDAKTAYLVGIYLARVGNFQEAEKFFEKSVSLAPNKQVIRFDLARIYLQNNKKEEALRLAKETYELDTSHDNVWNEYVRLAGSIDGELVKSLINAEIEAGRIERVEKFMLKNIETDPDNYKIYTSLAAFYFQTDQKEKSIETLEKAKTIFPDLAAQLEALIKSIQAGNNPLGQGF